VSIACIEESFIDWVFELHVNNGFHEDFVTDHVVNAAVTLQHKMSTFHRCIQLVHYRNDSRIIYSKLAPYGTDGRLFATDGRP